MNMDDYEQYILNKNDIEDQLGYLTEGLEVQVPEYIETGEIIKINTANCKFISRAWRRWSPTLMRELLFG